MCMNSTTPCTTKSWKFNDFTPEGHKCTTPPHVKNMHTHMMWAAQVRNTCKGGLLFFAPPCSTWVFLTPVCIGDVEESHIVWAIVKEHYYVSNCKRTSLSISLIAIWEVWGTMCFFLQPWGLRPVLGGLGLTRKGFPPSVSCWQTSLWCACCTCCLALGHQEKTNKYTKKNNPWFHSLEHDVFNGFQLRLFYAWRRGIHILVEQPISSALS